MANLYKDTLLLLFDILNGKTGEICKTDFIKAKPSFDRGIRSISPLPRSTPEAEGIPSEFLYRLILELSGKKTVNMHHFLVIRHGKVINETAFFPYKKGDWHITYSLCKTFVGMAIGILFDEGRLSLTDRVVDYFSENSGLWNSFKLRDLTIEHLLTMSSGSNFNEMGAITGNEWTKSFLSASLRGKPGEVFSYNSMNTYMLSAIVTKVTGQRLDAFLEERLFQKMGISQVFWEPSAENITKGGWGMFIRPEDAGKLGLLYLQNGFWNGERLISEEFVKLATTKRIENDFYGYGYQLWMGKREGSYNFDGMLGQNVRVYPDLDMVIVNNAGDSEVLMGGTMDEIIDRHMENPPVYDFAFRENKAEENRLFALSESLEKGERELKREKKGGWGRKTELSDERSFFHKLQGRTYELEDKSYGVFPLMLQVFHNLFTDGIREISFLKEKNRFFVYFKEGEKGHKIEIRLRDTVYMEFDFKGEPYLTAVRSLWNRDEDGNPVLTFRISYLEEVAIRIIKLRFIDDSISVEFDETPGESVIRRGIEISKEQAGESNFVVKKAFEAMPENLIKLMITSKMKPKTMAILKEREREEE